MERDTLPDSFEITAETDDGVIMGIRHREFPIEGVQFHPESILTPVGKDLLANFLQVKAAAHSEPATARCLASAIVSATSMARSTSSGGRAR